MSAFKSTALLTAVSLFAQAVRFVFQVLLSRTVGSEVMGLYQLVMPVMPVLMSLTAVGFTAACSNLTARAHAKGDRRACVQVVRMCTLGFLGAFALVALVVVPFSDAVSVYLLGDARSRLGLLLLLPCVFLTGLENIHKHYFYGTTRVAPPAVTEICEQLIRTGAVLGLLWAFLPQSPERTVGLIVLGMILCEVFSALTLTALFHRAVGPTTGAGLPRRELAGRIGRIALPMGCTALLGNLMGAWTAVLIPRQLVRAGADVSAAMSAFGILRGMTLPLLSLPTAVISAMGLVLLPKMAQAAALGRADLCRRRASKALSATLWLTLPAAVLMAVVAQPLGQVLFREKTVGELAFPLALGMALACVETVLAISLNGLGRQGTTAAHGLVSGAVQLFLTWQRMGVPGVGLRGYVEAFLLSTVLGVALNGWALHKAIGLKPDWFRWIAAPGLATLLAGACARLLLTLLTRAGAGDLEKSLTVLAFGGVLYLCAMIAQGVLPARRRPERQGAAARF